MSQATLPLTDDELAELDSFLLSDACDDEVLSVDELHGFLTALLVGPQPLPEAEWRKMAWGEPNFADAAQQQRMEGLIRALYDEVAESLQ